MPDPFERHSRANGCCETWSGQPSRSQLRAAAAAEQVRPEIAPEGKRPPGKKDKDLCKAVHWKGPHQPALRLHQFGWRRDVACKWALSWYGRDGDPSWHCAHEEFCTGCGKVLRLSIGDRECPGFRPITDAERKAIEEKRAEDDARVAAATRNRWQPKPPITGPQGYRRRKPGA